MDATIDLLTGARILKAERKGVCVELTLENQNTVILGAKSELVVPASCVCRCNDRSEIRKTAASLD